jgi:hypothetical protein
MLGLVDVDYHGQELVDAEAAVMQLELVACRSEFITADAAGRCC